LGNSLLFLQKVDTPTDVNAIEIAYDLAFEVMEECISYVYNEFATLGYCSGFANIDLSRFSFLPYTLNGDLFGWILNFEDDSWADELTNFDPNKWYL
jgi:hypothetical protein